jgi:hypothetical protein
MAADIYCGPAGALVKLPAHAQDMEYPLVRPSAVQILGDGGQVVHRFGRGRRRYGKRWQDLGPDDLSVIERLYLLPGPLILDDPNRRNRLTANQSSGSDTGRDITGAMARFQGTLASSTAQSRSSPRSFAWATGSALGSTGRGIYLYTINTAVDHTWHPVRPSTTYTVSGYLRSTAAVSMLAGFDWHDATGTYISTSAGSGVALSTVNFNTRVTFTATSPSTAAYGIPLFTNSTTTGAAITVYLDDPMVEEASAASAHVLGTGVPRVVPVGDLEAVSRMFGYASPGIVLQEVG